MRYGPGLFDLFRVTFLGRAFFHMVCPPGYIISEEKRPSKSVIGARNLSKKVWHGKVTQRRSNEGHTNLKKKKCFKNNLGPLNYYYTVVKKKKVFCSGSANNSPPIIVRQFFLSKIYWSSQHIISSFLPLYAMCRNRNRNEDKCGSVSYAVWYLIAY